MPETNHVRMDVLVENELSKLITIQRHLIYLLGVQETVEFREADANFVEAQAAFMKEHLGMPHDKYMEEWTAFIHRRWWLLIQAQFDLISKNFEEGSNAE